MLLKTKIHLEYMGPWGIDVINVLALWAMVNLGKQYTREQLGQLRLIFHYFFIPLHPRMKTCTVALGLTPTQHCWDDEFVAICSLVLELIFHVYEDV